MADAPNPALVNFIKGFFSGSVELGITMIPLIAAYNKAKKDPNWKEAGLQAWLTGDPNAAQMLANVCQQAQTTIPKAARDKIILALGGIPG
jgi:hypothetical protein